jgi:hypothetical protein
VTMISDQFDQLGLAKCGNVALADIIVNLWVFNMYILEKHLITMIDTIYSAN